MFQINVLVVTTSPDVKAEGIAASVDERHDMTLVRGRCLSPGDVASVLGDQPAGTRCALILVGRSPDTGDLTKLWMAMRTDLVVAQVDVIDDIVRIIRITVRDPRLYSVLDAVRDLVEGIDTKARGRDDDDAPAPRQLLDAAVEWLRQLLRDAVARVPDGNGDVHGLSVTRATLLEALDAAQVPANQRPRDLQQAEAALEAALAMADSTDEPLATARQALDLTPTEFRLLILGLAPELDQRFQRCLGFLLDEMPRRVGTSGLYAALLGSTDEIREALVRVAFGRWPVFDAPADRPPGADEQLRLDPYFAQWLLGNRDGLLRDPRVRRVLRLVPWGGADLIVRREDREHATALLSKLVDPRPSSWLVLGGTEQASARALLEFGAITRHVALIRVEAARLVSTDIVEVEECARRLARLRRLTGDPLVIDLSRWEGTETDDDALRLFLSTIGAAGGAIALLGRDDARLVRWLGAALFELVDDVALPREALVAAVRVAAKNADAYVTEEIAAAIVRRFPLPIDALETAMSLARSRPADLTADNSSLSRLMTACREVASEGLSNLADRIEPHFELDEVVLPADQHKELAEIVANVRHASRVLDEWQFGAQLPYGRGVTALFFGPSGTGKTMAAIGIARALDIQILRLDFSRVVSKFIGETEKNLDRIFTDAERSGSTILIDEADALFGKRSEVKDAHDRYANIEVAYLLQRMEAYRGLAILTTNLRQNLDPAFLRRLRFIIEFPRPDAEAREKIWRQCLPALAHRLDDRSFRQLARKIDLTGGHIRQITLRAAFIAAAAGTTITLEHIAQAARAEFAKLGMPSVDLDLGTGRQAA